MKSEDSLERGGWLPARGSAEAYRLGSKAMYLVAFASVLALEVVGVTAARDHSLDLGWLMVGAATPEVATIIGIDLEAHAQFEEKHES